MNITAHTAKKNNEYIIEHISLDLKFYNKYIIEQVQECANYENYDYVSDLEKVYETDEESMIDYIRKYEIISFYDFMQMYIYSKEEISDYFYMLFRLKKSNKNFHDEMYEDFISIQYEDYLYNHDDFEKYVYMKKDNIIEKYNNCLKSYNYDNRKIIQILKDYIY